MSEPYDQDDGRSAFPLEFQDDQAGIVEFRAISEQLFRAGTTAENRVDIRERAAMQRAVLESKGVDFDDFDDVDLLWHGWHTNARNWQPYILHNDPSSGMFYAALKAQQYSGMVMLLITEPTTPEPETA